MWIESLESRRLMSAAPLAASLVHPADRAAVRAVPTRLTANIIGSYSGTYRLGSNSFAGTEVMTIDSQTPTRFTGTLSFDDGPAVPFTAVLRVRAQWPALGFGWLFTFPYKLGTLKSGTHIQLKGEFQSGASGFIVQMIGRFNGKPIPKPHGELNLTPDDRSTFLR